MRSESKDFEIVKIKQSFLEEINAIAYYQRQKQPKILMNDSLTVRYSEQSIVQSKQDNQ
ncbi:hypothetical protein [Algoriphagus sp.]|uniref:hypothetical protein n=1 Tax=Algoriphagus sp. TaxID=1872435 RepID=UPI00326A49A7